MNRIGIMATAAGAALALGAGSAGAQEFSVAAQQEALDAFHAKAEQALQVGEQARLRGDCLIFRAAQNDFRQAERELDEASGGGAIFKVPPATVPSMRERFADLASRPCPPPGVREVKDFDFDDKPAVTVGWGKGEFDIPVTGVGFRREGNEPETFAGFTAGSVNFDSWQLTLQRPVSIYDLAVEFEFGEGDEEDWGEVPPNPNVFSGVVFGALSPADTSGVSVGGLGSQFTTATHIDFWRLRGRGYAPSLSATFPHVRLYGYVEAMRGERRHDMTQHHSGGGFVLDQERRQDISDLFFGGGMGLELKAPVTRRMAVFMSGSLGGYHRRSELDSFERNRCSFCPAAAQDFTIEVSESDEGFTVGGSASATLGYRLWDNVWVGGGVWYSRMGETGAVFNPWSGDQVFFDDLSTSLTTGEMSSQGWYVGTRFSF